MMPKDKTPDRARDSSDASAPARSSSPAARDETRAPAASRRTPTRDSLRKLLEKVLRSDSSFDAFCHDYHHEVYRHFSDGMDRVHKITLLLTLEDRSAIVDNLRRASPEATQRHEHLLEWESTIFPPEPKWRLLAVLLLGAMITIGAALFVTLRGPTLEPFPPHARGIALFGPWLDTDGGQAFCRELRARNPEPAAVQCISARLWETNVDALWKKAKRAGALVAGVIGERGVVEISSLGGLEQDTLIGGTLRLGRSDDLAESADRKRAAVLLDALARLNEPAQEFEPDHIPCPEIGPTLDRIALLTLLVVPQCAALAIDSSRFKDACGASTPAADETCALASYLDAEHNADAPEIRSTLEKLRDRGPARFQIPAELKLARLHCKMGHLPEASASVRALDLSAEPCVQARLPEIAACIFASDPLHIDADIQAIEERPIDPGQKCPERMRAIALARRAYYRGLGGRWDAAIKDYEAAIAISPDRLYRLNLAEAWLHKKSPKEAQKVLGVVVRSLDGPPSAPPSDRSKAALLEWIAARQGGDPSEARRAEAELLEVHRRLPAGKPALSGATVDEPLRALACDAPTSPDCIYNVLQRVSLEEELRQSFGR